MEWVDATNATCNGGASQTHFNAIQACIDGASIAGGGVVYLRAGRYENGLGGLGPINLRSGVILTGAAGNLLDNTGAILGTTAAPLSALIDVNSRTAVIGLFFDFTQYVLGTKDILRIPSGATAFNIRIENNIFYSGAASANAYILRATDGIPANFIACLTIKNNFVLAAGPQRGFHFTGAGSNLFNAVIRDNYISWDSALSGLAAFTLNGGEIFDSNENIVISGNIVTNQNVVRAGRGVDGTNFRKVQIDSNSLAGLDHGVYVGGSDNHSVTITNNTIEADVAAIFIDNHSDTHVDGNRQQLSARMYDPSGTEPLRTLMVHPSDCDPWKDSTLFSRSGNFMRLTNPGTFAICPVSLPPRSVIKEARCSYIDNSSVQDIQIALQAYRFTDTAPQWVDTIGTSAGSNPVIQSLTDTTLDREISADLVVHILFTNTGVDDSSDPGFHGCQLGYAPFE